jgi:hypothetical protein
MFMFRRLAVIGTAVLMVLAVPATALAASVGFSEIQYNSPGADSGSNKSLNQEWVVIENTSDHLIKLTGWEVREVRDANVFEFPTFRLRAGEKVTIYTGTGNDTDHKLYWGLDDYVWDNNRDVAVLKNRAGDVVDRCSYSGGGKSVEC